MASQRFQLGTFFGIRLYVHWTFTLLVAYVTYAAWASGASPLMVAVTVAQLFAVFLCVTLHEYGHALAAKRYRVETHDITLLPIGGVARLKQIPRVPSQELVIAIAGPAVNVVIASVLLLAILIGGGGWLFQAIVDASLLSAGAAQDELNAQITAVFTTPNLLGFALSLVAINTVLVLFNMIPAFPMDGGRVLRSLLALAMPYAQATRYAQRIGMVCAILMGMVALSSEQPRLVLLLISGFILFAGYAEVRQVEIYDMVQGLRVGDVMARHAPSLPANLPLPDVLRWWQTQPASSVAVVGINGVYLGVLHLQDTLDYLQRRPPARKRCWSLRRAPAGAVPAPASGDTADSSGEPVDPIERWGQSGEFGQRLPHGQPTAIDLANVEAQTLEPHDGLEQVLSGAKQTQRQFPVTDYAGGLVGWLDLDTIAQRCSLARLVPPASTPRAAEPISYLDQHA